MKVLYFGYRRWAYDVWLHLSPNKKGWEFCGAITTEDKKMWDPWSDAFIIPGKMTSKKMNSPETIELIDSYNPDLLLFVGWSWIVGKEILDKYPCLCLHPSPLPKYRGGSPLQHQIIAGEKETVASLFYMTEGIDDGPILGQEPFSLEGDLWTVSNRMYKASVEVIKRSLDGLANATLGEAIPQDESQATTYPRRKPSESRLDREAFIKWDLERLYNFIRCLEKPYPNAFIQDEEGNRLLFESVKFVRKEK